MTDSASGSVDSGSIDMTAINDTVDSTFYDNAYTAVQDTQFGADGTMNFGGDALGGGYADYGNFGYYPGSPGSYLDNSGNISWANPGDYPSFTDSSGQFLGAYAPSNMSAGGYDEYGNYVSPDGIMTDYNGNPVNFGGGFGQTLGGLGSRLLGMAPIAGTLAQGLIGSNAASNAAQLQYQASQDALAQQYAMYQQSRADQAPWREAGGAALGQLGAGLSGGISPGQFTHQFGASDLYSNLAPNYGFQLGQGIGALNNQAGVSGGLVGGNALKGLNDYAQNYAGNAYQNAFNNYQTTQSNIYNRLANVAGLGQTAANNTGTVGSQYAGNIGSAQLAGGAAQGAGAIGVGNALGGAADTIGNIYLANNMTGGQLLR